MSTLGERLKNAREKKGLSQTEVAKRKNINNKTLSRYEKDGTEPDLETLKILAELYEVSIEYLINYEAKENNYSVGKKGDLINEEKLKLADMILNLPDNEKKLVMDMVEALNEKGNK